MSFSFFNVFNLKLKYLNVIKYLFHDFSVLLFNA